MSDKNLRIYAKDYKDSSIIEDMSGIDYYSYGGKWYSYNKTFKDSEEITVNLEDLIKALGKRHQQLHVQRNDTAKTKIFGKSTDKKYKSIDDYYTKFIEEFVKNYSNQQQAEKIWQEINECIVGNNIEVLMKEVFEMIADHVEINIMVNNLKQKFCIIQPKIKATIRNIVDEKKLYKVKIY